ncbi:MAG: Ig-like domain-containing protein [Firmicutes bacterium]|nr:Ig-like domain-containing protein [Bacillota bacterium]
MAMKQGFKQISAAASVMLVLGMAGAPAFAAQHGEHDGGKKASHAHHRYDQGQGNQNNPGLVGPAAPPAPPAPGSMGQAQSYLGLSLNLNMNLGPAGWLAAVPPKDRGPQGPGRGRFGFGDDHFMSGAALVSMLAARQKTDDPLVQSDLQALQTEIQTAAALQAQMTAAASTATTTTSAVYGNTQSVNTSADLTIEQQMQTVLSQMASATSTEQLTASLQQLVNLQAQLNAAISGPQAPQAPGNPGQWSPQGPGNQGQWGDQGQGSDQNQQGQWGDQGQGSGQVQLSMFTGAVNRAKYDYNEIENRYDAINQDVTNYLNLYSSSASTLSGDQIRQGLRLLVEYRDGAFWAMNGLQRVDDALTLIAQSSTTATTSTTTGTSTSTTTGTTSTSTAATVPTTLTSTLTTPTYVGANTSETVTYTLLNASGAPVAGQTVDFALQTKVGPAAETTSETAEAPGTLSATSGVTNADGQVSVTYTSSATADGDGDLADVVVATAPSASLTNTQAQFDY